MPHYLYRIQPTRPAMLIEGPTPQEAEIISVHFDYLQRLTQQGVVILAGRTLNTDPTSFGIVILQTPDEAAARAIMENDPAVQRGVMRAEFFLYRIALWSPPREE
jgi:uncharacterized protein YciI